MAQKPKKKQRRVALGVETGSTAGRRVGGTSLPDKHVVYAEGMTEKHCIDELRAHFRWPHQRVEVFGSIGVPKTIVKKALARLKAEKSAGTPVCVYAVFDRDEHSCFQVATPQLVPPGNRAGVQAGVSVPCFELWALLLHRDQTAHIERDAAQRELKGLHTGYDHDRGARLNVGTVIANAEVAAQRSRNLAARAVDAGDQYCNPTSTFSDVLGEIFPEAFKFPRK